MTKPKGDPEDWPVEEPPEDTSSPDEGRAPEQEERETGDRERLRRD